MADKRVRKSRRNRGGYLLQCTGQSQAEIAKKLGVTQAAVAQYIKGTVKPVAAKRGLFLQAFGIAIAAWDEELRPSKPAKDSPDDATAIDLTLPEVASNVAAAVQADLEKVQADPGLAPKTRAETLSKLASTLTVLGRMSGEHAIDRAKILAHPEFKEAVETFMGEVRPCKDCLERAVPALRKLGSK